MKKTLDTSKVLNELRGQSVFFPRHQVDQQIESSLPEAPEVQELSHPVPPVRVVPPVPPTPPQKRVMKQRHPFDIYQDQYLSLKELALQDRKQGGIGSMSAMVREALDKYISEK